MTQITNTQTSKYNLETRTLKFSKQVIRVCKKLEGNTINFKLIDQLMRASTSVGANYREANDALSKKDFIHRLRITRKVAKETVYWLELLMEANLHHKSTIEPLLSEALELKNIFSAMINNTVKKNV
jgi:four helix bundle protein